jgi:hypothetical protein
MKIYILGLVVSSFALANTAHAGDWRSLLRLTNGDEKLAIELADVEAREAEAQKAAAKTAKITEDMKNNPKDYDPRGYHLCELPQKNSDKSLTVLIKNENMSESLRQELHDGVCARLSGEAGRELEAQLQYARVSQATKFEQKIPELPRLTTVQNMVAVDQKLLQDALAKSPNKELSFKLFRFEKLLKCECLSNIFKDKSFKRLSKAYLNEMSLPAPQRSNLNRIFHNATR